MGGAWRFISVLSMLSSVCAWAARASPRFAIALPSVTATPKVNKRPYDTVGVSFFAEDLASPRLPFSSALLDDRSLVLVEWPLLHRYPEWRVPAVWPVPGAWEDRSRLQVQAE